MKINKSDIFENDKIKCLTIFIIFIIIILVITKDSIKKYLEKNKNGFNDFIYALITFDTEKLYNIISGIITSIVKGIVKTYANDIDFVLNETIKADNIVIDASKHIYASISGFLNSSNSILNSIENTLFPIFKKMFGIKDALSKINAVMVTMLFSMLGGVMINATLMGSTIQAITVFLEWLWGAVLFMPPLLPLGIFLSVFAGIMLHYTKKIYNLSAVPSAQSNFSAVIPKRKHHRLCFYENTILRTNNGEKRIKDLTLEDKLLFNGENIQITGILKLDGTNQKLYNINNIIVSESHKILFNDKWIFPYKHPKSKLLNYKEKYLYCLNTKNNVIQINDEIFLDWDEIYEVDSDKLKFPKDNIQYFTSWLEENTKILMNDNSYKKLKDIKIGDILKNNNKVYGTINLGNKQMYKYNINNLNIRACKNLIYYLDNKKYSTINDIGITSPIIGKGLQLITDTKIIQLYNNLIIGDYDSSIDNLIY